MRGYYSILVLLGLILLVPHAMALNPADVTWEITESEVTDGWLVAGGTETATITVKIDTSSLEIDSASFSIENDLGIFDSVKTLSPNKVQTVFKPKTKSGKGNISVELSFVDNVEPTQTFTNYTPIQIDHNAPYEIASVDYPSEPEVNTLANITVRMVDEYGNWIDNLNEIEYVKFSCSSSAEFVDGIIDVTVPVDEYGNATAQFHVPTKAGENVIFIDPKPSRPLNRWITIYGVGEKTPAEMMVFIDPPSQKVVAKSGERFEISLLLMDRYGNPSPNSPINVKTNVEGENQITVWTNQNGIAKVYYGPKNTVGTVILTATPGLNETLAEEISLDFVFGFEQIIQMSANKNVIASKDLSVESRSEISAILLGDSDVIGKPITFTIVNHTGDVSDIDEDPYLDNLTTNSNSSLIAYTNQKGKAAVYFYPGSFSSTDAKIINTTVKATYVTSTYELLEETIIVQWRNDPYPYANVTVYPDASMCVPPGTNLTVEIKIVADGKIGRPAPVDVVLAICRSEQMFEDIQMEFNETDKMLVAMDVANDFVDNLSASGNHFGLVTFGEKEYSEYEGIGSGFPGDDTTTLDDEFFAVANYPYFDRSNVTWPESKGGFPSDQYENPNYGRNYTEYATVDKGINSGTIEIEDAIDLITPSADTPNPSISSPNINPTRYGVYRALSEVIHYGQANIQAVILLVDDRHSTTYGDPVAGATWVYEDRHTGYWKNGELTDGKGTTVLEKANYPAWYYFTELSADEDEQNLAVWAVNNDVRIYTVAIPKKGLNNISTDQEEIYRYLTYPTGGNFYLARNYEELQGAFEEIQGELRDIAAENATMDLDFVSPISEDIPVNKTVYEIFNYVYEPGPYSPPEYEDYTGILGNESTVIRHWNWTSDPAQKEAQELSKFSDSEIYKNFVVDQSDEWDSKMLTFGKDRLGTIKINHTWVARIGLQINSTIDESMLFNLFGNNSGLFFGEEGSKVKLPLPNYTICVDPGIVPMEMNSTLVGIENLTHGTITTEKVPISWNLSYSGQDSMLQETIEVMNDYGGWNTVGVQMVRGNETFDTFDWYYNDYSLKTYTIRVSVISNDAGYARATHKITLATNPPYIRIK